jgi:hypothetical protein
MMGRKSVFLMSFVLVAALINGATAEVLVHYSFDGSGGFPAEIMDDMENVTFKKVEDTGTVTYGEANPFYNSGLGPVEGCGYRAGYPRPE